jgi:hypothetical protein
MKKSLKTRNWVMVKVSIGGSRPKVTENDLGIKWYKKKLKSGLDGHMYGRISIGNEVRKSLGWKAGDQIGVYYDKDSEMDFMLTKLENSKGASIIETPGKFCFILFKWDGKTIVKETEGRHAHLLEFEHDKKCIYFSYIEGK